MCPWNVVPELRYVLASYAVRRPNAGGRSGRSSERCVRRDGHPAVRNRVVVAMNNETTATRLAGAC